MKIDQNFYDSLPTFNAYFKLINDLFENGKTTGEDQSDKMINYTKLSLARTKRGLKTFSVSDELINAAKHSSLKNWLIISEAWCGDAGNIIPLIKLLADQIEGVALKVMIRDQHIEVMEQFLTNGSKAIPIFVAMDDQLNYQNHWGPRPKPAQDMVLEHKKHPEESYDEFAIELQKWYIKDKGSTLSEELIQYFKNNC